MQSKFLKRLTRVLCIYFIISCFSPNVMSQIGKWKVEGTNTVPEIEKVHDVWEWKNGLEWMGALGVNYKEEYLRKDILFISLHFQYNSNDIGIGCIVNLSESDKVGIGLSADYDYEEKKLVYNPVYIWREELGDTEIYTDEKTIDEYLNKYGLTRQDVKEYQEYAIYDVVVKTWSRAHITKMYWLEKLKLKMCEVEDNTFWFEEE